MLELLSAFSFVGIHQLASLLFGVVRTKIIALLLGPYGVGIISQANNFLEMVRQFASLGIGDGFLKLLAETRQDQEEKRLHQTILIGTLTFGALGILIAITSTLFSRPLAFLIFSAEEFHWIIPIVAIAGFFYAEYFTFLYIFQAMLKWKEYAFVSVSGYLFNILISVILILFSGVWGAIFSIMIAQGINLIIAVIVLRKSALRKLSLVRLFIRERPEWTIFKKLIRFIGPLGSVALISNLSILLIRSTVIHTLGVDANGIYQVVYGISLAYMGLIRNAFFAFGMPKVTVSLHCPADMVQVQNDELRLGLLMLCPLTLFLLLTRVLWIPLLYSDKFLSAGLFLAWQFLADILRTCRLTMNISLLPLERYRFILLDSAIEWVGWVGLTIVLIPPMGISAVPLSQMLSGLVSLVVAYAYHRKTSAFKVSKKNQSLIVKALMLTLPALLLAQWGTGAVLQFLLPALLLVLMGVLLPTREEFAQLFRYLRKKTS